MNLTKHFQIINIEVEDKKLDDLKILHLSDLHINKKTSIEKILELVNFCNSLEFDFCIITGDIIDTKVKFIKKQLEILNLLKKEVFYISGNHDLFYGLEDLKKELTNFIFMDNETFKINYKNEIIHLAGLPDRFSKFFKIKREEKVVEDFLKNSPSIFISHQPKDYKIALNSNSNLFLCGHTHGGQIYPFHYLVKLVQPFLAGLFYKNKTAIYVNKGLGTWGVDFRFKANAEITILKLITKSVK
ncbi:metallophosphoesterase [Aliarcobacter butzleri]|uniref:metallophosphoesterase n=1 Tax=Aliarcobacter butzleri TaxID=28197 RepID=UPI000658C968|nr:metallophosphoesterase [Aliarcobacter butzleri]KLE04404.1 Ser/Thr protein phosphatase [Aliarcobacter butzleri L353]MCG3673354.1 metallophosphoesterase [Aliarcobacter butzleri]MCT7596876.1 metallophosphoesterase [Aliarcobacter butzleri]MCT7605623.1 metallophosphoesterase [Aliarcobacter butzleri]MCT7608048.1 metallophosphoesterase [Aliarcobacter butzleri]